MENTPQMLNVESIAKSSGEADAVATDMAPGNSTSMPDDTIKMLVHEVLSEPQLRDACD